MTRSVDALVNPSLLVWARQSAGLQPEDAAKKVPVKPERLASWERGETRPSIKQLRKLGNAYKRPIAVFYLSEAPAGFQVLRDFRRLPGAMAATQSPELLLQVRRAHDRRELAAEMFEALEGELPELALGASLSDDPEGVASMIREFLKVRFEDQVRWVAGYEAFNHWRTALEDAGVLVFQATGVEVSEMRGFSIYADKLPAVVVNNKDSIRGRLFTMLHELAHLALRQASLCIPRPEDVSIPSTDDQRIEVFCNAVAGATLVPRGQFLDEPAVQRNERDADWDDASIQDLADRYGVSREVILRRLLVNERISNALYSAAVNRIREEYARAAESERREGFAPPHRVAVSSAGPMFVKLVLNSYHGELITASDVADFLDVRLKHLPRIEADVLRNVS